MPRHTARARPRHRAQRQGLWPGRARLHAAQGRAGGGLASSLGPALGAARRIALHPDSRRLIRGVLLTPWFAVSAGLVIAASLTLATPRAALTFPSTRSGHCLTAGCAVPGRGRLPTTKKGVKLRLRPKPKKHDRQPSPLRSSPPGTSPGPVVIRYARIAERNGDFIAMITISGRKPLGYWTLRFELPGGSIDKITWAKWEHAGKAGVIIHGRPSPWPRSGANRVTLAIFGSGTPRRPRGCLFDGASCSFRALRHSDFWHSRDGRAGVNWWR